MQTNDTTNAIPADHIGFISAAFANVNGSIQRHVHVQISGQWFHVYGEKGSARTVYQQNGRSSRKVNGKIHAETIIRITDRLEETQPEIFRFR